MDEKQEILKTIGGGTMKEQFYSDGVTRITDPFYTCLCPAGHKQWEITRKTTCSVCGRKLLLCMPSDQYVAEHNKVCFRGGKRPCTAKK